MPTLADCLGKIKLTEGAHFWNEADHAALQNKAKRGGDIEAVKSFMDEVKKQQETIGKVAAELAAAKKPPIDKAIDEMMPCVTSRAKV
jgi:hypothetical protein